MLSSIELNIVHSYTKINLRIMIYILLFYLFLFVLIYSFSYSLGIVCSIFSVLLIPYSLVNMQSILSRLYCREINTVYYDYTSIDSMSTSYNTNKEHLISTFTLFARLISKTKVNKLPYPFGLFCEYKKEYPREFKEFCIRNAGVEIDLSNITEQASNDVKEYYKAISKQLYPDYKIKGKLYPNIFGY